MSLSKSPINTVNNSNTAFPFLEEPTKLAEQNWPDDIEPLVSINCKTYMHGKFIRKAIEGFLSQKTTFKVEVLIHDDASPDGTADIVRKYEAKFPQLIKATYQIENQYRKNPKTPKYVKPHPRIGKYVAMCEGDDYWTDPLKLQKQVAFLETHPDHILCAGGYTALQGDKRHIHIIDSIRGVKQSRNPGGFSFDLMDTTHKWMVKTLTVVFRNRIEELGLDKYKHRRDVHLFYHLLKLGKGYYFKENFGVYTMHEGGIQSLVSRKEIARIAYIYYQELHFINQDEFTRIMRLKSIAYFIRASQVPFFSAFNRKLMKEYGGILKTPLELQWLVAAFLKKHKKE